MLTALPHWALEMAQADRRDQALPFAIPGVNVVLNRARLAGFLAAFSEDRDVQDLVALDIAAKAAGLPVNSTGLAEETEALAVRPFRIWEYCWLYKSLRLSRGGWKVLDLGGPASHLSVLAAMAGCQVISLDVNPDMVRAAQESARALCLETLDARLGDMRDLSSFAAESFDMVVSCSVLEHLTAADQQATLREVERVLRPGGLAGFTFDFGIAAQDVNLHLTGPHEPPAGADEALRRYRQGRLVVAGNAFEENPVAGGLFREPSIRYNIASLFLAKPPAPDVALPVCEESGRRLTGFPIRRLPRLVHQRAASGAALLNALQAEREQWRQAASRNALETNRELETVAAARLAGMLEKEAEIQRLRAELDARQETIENLDSNLKHAIAVINEHHGAKATARALHFFGGKGSPNSAPKP